MKHHYLTFLVLTYCGLASSLTAQTLSPNPDNYGQCPGTTTYTINGLNANCNTFSVVLVSGYGTISNINGTNKTFDLLVDDVINEVVINLYPTVILIVQLKRNLQFQLNQLLASCQKYQDVKIYQLVKVLILI